jgi:hypothetical protein
MRNVYVASSLADATLVKNLLSENDIECQTVEKLRGNIGAPYTEVWVLDDSDGDRAIRLIREVQSENDPGESWTCTACSESNPSSFSICWKCGSEHLAAIRR